MDGIEDEEEGDSSKPVSDARDDDDACGAVADSDGVFLPFRAILLDLLLPDSSSNFWVFLNKDAVAESTRNRGTPSFSSDRDASEIEGDGDKGVTCPDEFNRFLVVETADAGGKSEAE